MIIILQGMKIITKLIVLMILVYGMFAEPAAHALDVSSLPYCDELKEETQKVKAESVFTTYEFSKRMPEVPFLTTLMANTIAAAAGLVHPIDQEKPTMLSPFALNFKSITDGPFQPGVKLEKNIDSTELCNRPTQHNGRVCIYKDGSFVRSETSTELFQTANQNPENVCEFQQTSKDLAVYWGRATKGPTCRDRDTEEERYDYRVMTTITADTTRPPECESTLDKSETLSNERQSVNTNIFNFTSFAFIDEFISNLIFSIFHDTSATLDMYCNILPCTTYTYRYKGGNVYPTANLVVRDINGEIDENPSMQDNGQPWSDDGSTEGDFGKLTTPYVVGSWNSREHAGVDLAETQPMSFFGSTENVPANWSWTGDITDNSVGIQCMATLLYHQEDEIPPRYPINYTDPNDPNDANSGFENRCDFEKLGDVGTSVTSTNPGACGGGYGGCNELRNHPHVDSAQFDTELTNAAADAGIPKCVLEGVAIIEGGDRIPEIDKEQCLTQCVNSCSAAGSMQFTTGTGPPDDPNCTGCGAGYCPNAWGNRTGNPCSWHDSVQAAARKIRNDSGMTSEINYTRIRYAGYRYYGSDAPVARLCGCSYGEYLYQHCVPSYVCGSQTAYLDLDPSFTLTADQIRQSRISNAEKPVRDPLVNN